MKKNIICGYNLTCVGDDGDYSYITSRNGNNLAEELLEKALKGKKNVKKYTFIDRGSDERQYCAPGIDLPVCSFLRSKEFKEYHTDKDNFSIVSQKGLEGSFNVIKKIIDQFEKNIYPKNNILCEPNLGKRNMYPTISQKGIYKNIKSRMDLIAFSDGNTSLREIAKKISQPYSKILSEYKLLKFKKILS
jgi:aminopeptidase-like protein